LKGVTNIQKNGSTYWYAYINGEKLWITSLNSHFCSTESSTKCGSSVSRGKVWIKVCNLQSRLASLDLR
jgi:hypothetical protein